MLLTVAIVLSVGALLALLFWPVTGIVLLFISKPVIDTTFAQPLLFGLHLTELVGVAVPLVVLGHMAFATPERAWSRMPLRWIWTVYVADVIVFSMVIAYNQDLLTGANVLFRQLNGFVGFYLLQAFFHGEKGLKTILLAMIAAGLFPVGVGVYQLVTGAEWIHAEAETLTRYIGLYHDAFTIRAYVLQTLIALLLYAALYVRRSLLLKGAALAYGIVALVVLLRAYSKAGILSLGLWAFSWTTLQKKFVALALVVALVAVGGLYYSDDIAANVTQLFHKELGALDGTVDTKRTFAGRWYGWQDMIARWHGFDWPQKAFGSGELAVGAHNDYLLLLFHGGVVGLAIYLALLTAIGTRIVLNLWQRIDPLAVGALMLFLMWLVDTIGLVPSSYPGYQWFVWGMIGLSVRLREEETSSATAPAAVDAITDHTRTQDSATASALDAGCRYPIIAPRKTLSGI
jgi:hypothetical protein